MSVIQSALMELNAKLERLEAAALAREEKAALSGAGSGRGLFGDAVVNGNGKSDGHRALDPVMLTQKLDVAIEKVEQILREG